MGLPYAVVRRLAAVRAAVEPPVRRVLFGAGPSWRRQANVLPWLDAPDADAKAAASGADAPWLRQWVRDGYVVADGLVDAADVDAMLATLDGLWDAPAPIPHLDLLGLRDVRGGEQYTLSHEALLARPPGERARIRAASDWRIHGFHYVNASARRLFGNRRLRATASRLLGRRARPFAAINFMCGSQQDLHQDMGVFHVWPQNWLLGAWIACEDVAADSGPLVLYPGSHRAPFFPGFADYPQTNLRTADAAGTAAYHRYVEKVAARFPRKEFLATKGQVLFWHGMLVHGGAPVARPGSTRKSMVLHYTVRGADRAREVQGPFRW
ncbi:MAG: phytanoyl-CoA dioxygenase family protein [bacterium]|nr:phytanoyl-CoA dioxygenase family protein [bacterium]